MPQTTIPDFPLDRAPGCPFDPPPHLATLRAQAPLVRVRIWDGQTPWLVTRYEDQRAVLADPRFSADPSRPGFPAPTEGFTTQGHQEAQALSMQDDPEHARQRRMLMGRFTVKQVTAMTPRLERITDDLLDRMQAAGPPTDLVEAFALPMPSLVIGELLGVPRQDHALFRRAACTMVSRESTAREFTAARTELADSLGHLIRRKDHDPGDDLLSSLAVTRLRTGELTPALLVEIAMTLLIAGHEATTNQLALGTLLLLRHPDRLAVVRDSDDPARVASAVEELLRYLTKELRVAYPALLCRFPGLRTTLPDEDIRSAHDMLVHGVHALPVSGDPDPAAPSPAPAAAPPPPVRKGTHEPPPRTAR
ncbi:cytochrome P450 [Streptomyces sp. NPDC014733]|uniref:cytochrome P450 n=1 Tax=Streptomyces sp. NPDC014733 TaxID=3364885 RepID=UPI0036F54EBB